MDRSTTPAPYFKFLEFFDFNRSYLSWRHFPPTRLGSLTAQPAGSSKMANLAQPIPSPRCASYTDTPANQPQENSRATPDNHLRTDVRRHAAFELSYEERLNISLSRNT